MRTRSLALALALAVLPASAAALDCIPVSGYDNMVLSYEDQGLVVALATDRADYDLGETINFCLVLENTGTDTLWWTSGAAPMHGFCVLSDTCEAFTQPGCQDASLFWYPGMITWFGDGIQVLPGECVIRYATWDGWVVVYDDIGPYYFHLELPAAGSYRVFGGLWGQVNPGSWLLVEYFVPASSIWLTIHLGPDVPVRPASWGGLKTLYR
jgi:hypothetical protein